MRIRSKVLSFLVVTWCCLLTAQVVNASTSIAYIKYSSSGTVDYLTSYGYSVTYLNNPTGLTAGSLAGYSAVLVSSNSPFSEPSTIGEALKGFADAGGGVVLGEFSFQGHWALRGGIMTSGYSPFTVDSSSSGYYISLGTSLGTIYKSGHPLLAGASGVDASYQADVALDSGATLVADWASGRHAIAYNTLSSSSSVVAVNMFPNSTYANSYDQRLWANALAYSIGSGNPTVPVPGAIALLSLGLGLASRVRRRQTA